MRRLSIFILFIIIPAISILVATIVFDQNIWPLIIAVLPPWSYALYKVLYDSWDKFHFFIDRVSAYWLNAQVDWEIRAEYQDFNSSTAMTKVMSCVKSVYSKTAILVDDERQKIIRADGLSLQLRSTTEPLPAELDERAVDFLIINTMPMNQTFRRARSEVNRFINILEGVARSIDASKQKYELRIIFGEVNPYLSFYVQRAKMEQMTHFQCEFLEQVGTYRDSISIGKDRIIIVTQDALRLATLANEYLSMAPPSH